MMRSLSSAVTGLRSQQTAMDIIGNNIANINTTGFKSSVTNFEDLFYQTLNGGTSNVNPSQIGYGAQVAGVSKNMTGGGATTTDNPTDLYINGEGYFNVNTKADGTGTTYYTRVGDFHFNSNGYLVDANGNFVMNSGFTGTGAAGSDFAVHLSTTSTTATPADPTTSTISMVANDGSGTVGIPEGKAASITNIAINNDGTITGTYNGKTGLISNGATNTNIVGLSTFPDEAGLTQVGDNYYEASTASGKPAYTTAGGTNTTTLQSSALEMSNVDLSREFTNMIVTERGFQANSRVITVSDTMLEELLNLKRS